MTTSASRRASLALDALCRPPRDPERARTSARAAWLHLSDAGVLANAGPDWVAVIEATLAEDVSA